MKQIADEIRLKISELNALIEKAAKEKIYVKLHQQYVDEENPNFERPAIITEQIFSITYSAKDEYPLQVLKSYF